MQRFPYLVIAFLLFVLSQYYVSSKNLDEALPVLAQRAQRFEWQVDLTGRTMPPSVLALVDPNAEEAGWSFPTQSSMWNVLWIIDAAKCIGCLADIYDWNGLPGPNLRATLIISGVDASTSQGMAARAGIRTAVIADPTGSWRKMFQMELSSLRLLVHPDGTVLLADTRNPAATCYWQFATQVRRLLDPTDTTPLISTDGDSPMSLGNPLEKAGSSP